MQSWNKEIDYTNEDKPRFFANFLSSATDSFSYVRVRRTEDTRYLGSGRMGFRR
jgi:hypothetical protein